MAAKRVVRLTPAGAAQERRKSRGALMDSAFEVWYSLGVRRNYKEVASRFGVSVGTVSGWAHKYRWAERARRVDGEIQSRLQGRFADIFVERRAELLMLVRTQIGQYAQLVREGLIVPVDVKDLERLVRLEMELSGMTSGSSPTRGGAVEWPEDMELAQITVKTKGSPGSPGSLDGPGGAVASGDGESPSVEELRAIESALAKLLSRGGP